MKKATTYLFLLMQVFSTGCKTDYSITAEQWKEIELAFTAETIPANPYTDIEFYAEFTGPSGNKLVRPGFWDGGNSWKIRFASPDSSGTWNWETFSSSADKGLNGKKGIIKATPYKGDSELIRNGLLKMSDGKRNVIHANGKVFLMIGDTPWALPWRATVEAAKEYAARREEQGFNAALLMSLNPDRDASGPRNRTESGGFDVAFEDLKEGHLNSPNISYFKYFDTLRKILVDHGIVPVFQPVFHGFGWKGLNVLGWDMDAGEYARYCRYLVARYGAGPAIYLVSGDSDGRNKGVSEGGEEIEKWDAYRQPAGIHYSPFDDYVPDWWNRKESYVPHLNKIHQDSEWLDFQWCQTGHSGQHLFHKVERMYHNQPVKAVANGEPTYEGIRDSANGSGWWQGHEAWSQFLSGGTMGVVYGAGSLWNWKLFPDEKGWDDWANSNRSWRDALYLPGANYVGFLSKALDGLDLADIEKHSELTDGKLCLAKPGQLYIAYLPDGGSIKLTGIEAEMEYKWFDPVKGEFMEKGILNPGNNDILSGKNSPMVLIVTKTTKK